MYVLLELKFVIESPDSTVVGQDTVLLVAALVGNIQAVAVDSLADIVLDSHYSSALVLPLQHEVKRLFTSLFYLRSSETNIPCLCAAVQTHFASWDSSVQRLRDRTFKVLKYL